MFWQQSCCPLCVREAPSRPWWNPSSWAVRWVDEGFQGSREELVTKFYILVHVKDPSLENLGIKAILHSACLLQLRGFGEMILLSLVFPNLSFLGSPFLPRGMPGAPLPAPTSSAFQWNRCFRPPLPLPPEFLAPSSSAALSRLPCSTPNVGFLPLHSRRPFWVILPALVASNLLLQAGDSEIAISSTTAFHLLFQF